MLLNYLVQAIYIKGKSGALRTKGKMITREGTTPNQEPGMIGEVHEVRECAT